MLIFQQMTDFQECLFSMQFCIDLGLILEPTWAGCLGTPCRLLGVSWACLGGVLAGSWRSPPGGLGASWLLGLSWDGFGTVLASF